MLNKIKKLSKKYPNDADFGEAVRTLLIKNLTCCDKQKNLGYYFDGRGVVFPQCKKCGKILM